MADYAVDSMQFLINRCTAIGRHKYFDHFELNEFQCDQNIISNRAILPESAESEKLWSRWNADDGFTSDELRHNEYAFPRPVAGILFLTKSMTNGKLKILSPFSFDNLDAGMTAGMQLLLNANSKEDYCSSAETTGFKMIVHEPHVHPRVKDFSQLVPLAHESRFIIDSFLLEPLPSIRKTSLNDRKCRFQDENHLEFYRFV